MIDLNCDVGEGYGRWTVGDDAELLRLVTSANIACGFHAGDPAVMRATVELARRFGVAAGAHPGYPDLQGFGRRTLDLLPAEVEDMVLYQIGALYAFTRVAGVELVHVKPHGALYNRAAEDAATAHAIARAVASFSADLMLVALSGSMLVAAGREHGLAVAQEAFADRAYEPDGSLRSRKLPGAVLDDPQAIVDQAVGIARDRRVRTAEGASIVVEADTICLHGDTPGAARLAHALREGLAAAGVRIRPLREVVPSRSSG